MNHDISWCNEQTLYSDSIQLLILKPIANEQVILSTLTFVTGLLQACLFWNRTVEEFDPLIDFYPLWYFDELCMQVPVCINNMWKSITSQWGNAVQSSLMPKNWPKINGNIWMQTMLFHMRTE